jgi:hypothetical protein
VPQAIAAAHEECANACLRLQCINRFKERGVRKERPHDSEVGANLRRSRRTGAAGQAASFKEMVNSLPSAAAARPMVERVTDVLSASVER